LLVCLLLTLGIHVPTLVDSPAADAANGPVFPPYVYVTASGPTTFDVMRGVIGKESRLARIGVDGSGFGDVAAQMAPDGAHVAVRQAAQRTGGSSLRIIDTKTTKAITVTLSRGGGSGIGAFAWSPDSKSLAYTVASPQRAVADQGDGTLWVVGANAKGARKVGGVSARLAGWSPDGTALYYTRDDDDAATPPDLWNLALTGKTGAVVRSSAGTLQYNTFAVASRVVLSTTAAPGAVVSGTVAAGTAAPGGVLSGTVAAAPGTARFAALAAGNLGPLANGANPPPAKPTARVATTDTLGIVIGDTDGSFHTLHDLGEAYTVLAWDPTGTHLLMSGGKSGTAWYADATTGQRWRLPAAANGLAPIAWTPDGHYVLLADNPATRLVTLNLTNGTLVRSRSVGGAAKADKAAKDLAVPYVNQIWDTGIAFNGNWACGPTSVAMVLAYYGRLNPWPFDAKQVRTSAQDRIQIHAAGAESGTPDLLNGKLYGQYVVAPFKYKSRSFSLVGADPAGHKAAGLYGTIVGNAALARWEVMIDVLNLYDVQTSYIEASWASITAQIDKGYPVILGTTLTDSGHIVVVRGYTANGYLLINDPYGNRATGYGGDDGGDVAYAWKSIPIKLVMTARGTITPPATTTPTTSATPQPTPAHGTNGGPNR
jgi:hypothetical protein